MPTPDKNTEENQLDASYADVQMTVEDEKFYDAAHNLSLHYLANEP